MFNEDYKLKNQSHLENLFLFLMNLISKTQRSVKNFELDKELNFMLKTNYSKKRFEVVKFLTEKLEKLDL